MRESIDDPNDKNLSVPMEMVNWWEKKRLIYNAIIMVFTVLLLWSLWEYVGRKVTAMDVISDAFWLIMWLNILYSSGWGLGILRLHYFGGYPLEKGARWFLFVVGTLFTLFILNFHFILLINPQLEI